MIRILLLCLATLGPLAARAEEPATCNPLPECNTALLPDGEISSQCSEEDVERCLVIERRSCNYFVLLHGRQIAGGAYGYVVTPSIYADARIETFTIVGNYRGVIEFTTQDGTSPEAYWLPEMETVSGKKLHVKNGHFAFVSTQSGRRALNVDGKWHNLPRNTIYVYNLRFAESGYQVALDYQIDTGEESTFIADTRSTLEFIRK